MAPQDFLSKSLLLGILIGIVMAVVTLVLAQWFAK
jgi:hypothetical protein